MRAFLAINLPRDVRAALHDALAPVRDRMPGVRWLDAESLHITVKFLGDVEGIDVERISAAMHEVLSGHEPFQVHAGGLGAFPSLSRASIVWVGIAPEPRLDRMQRAVELAMSRLGFAREQRPFRAHITVGRTRREVRPPSLERLAGLLEYRGEAPVTAVDLMRSHTNAEGARYELLSRYGMGAREFE